MDGTVRCRYSGAPFCPLTFPAAKQSRTASTAVPGAIVRPSGPPARRKHCPPHEERPP